MSSSRCCLNPCCNGIGEIYSNGTIDSTSQVLILVVMVLGKLLWLSSNSIGIHTHLNGIDSVKALTLRDIYNHLKFFAKVRFFFELSTLFFYFFFVIFIIYLISTYLFFSQRNVTCVCFSVFAMFFGVVSPK